MNTFLIAYFSLCLGGLIGWLARHAVAREQAASGENEGIFEHQRQQAVPAAASAKVVEFLRIFVTRGRKQERRRGLFDNTE